MRNSKLENRTLQNVGTQPRCHVLPWKSSSRGHCYMVKQTCVTTQNKGPITVCIPSSAVTHLQLSQRTNLTAVWGVRHQFFFPRNVYFSYTPVGIVLLCYGVSISPRLLKLHSPLSKCGLVMVVNPYTNIIKTSLV
jgi:hypothetical protein